MPLTTPVAKGSREIVNTSLGLIAETYDLAVTQLTTTATSQRMRVAAVGLNQGALISNVTVLMTILGSSLTLVKVGIYDKTGANLLASSADQKALFAAPATTGFVPVPLSTAYTVPTTDAYILAFLAVGTTTPALALGANNINVGRALNSVPLYGYIDSQADLPASLPAFTSNQQGLWAGVS